MVLPQRAPLVAPAAPLEKILIYLKGAPSKLRFGRDFSNAPDDKDAPS